jgi:hypothetical protein
MLEALMGSSLFPPLFQAALGGIVLSIINLWEDYQKPKSRRVVKDRLYVFFFFVWPAIGVILAYVYVASGYKIDGMLAFTLGLTAPTTAMIAKARHTDHPPPGAEPP